MTERTAVHIMRLPITVPCPVKVTPEGESIRDGEPIPDEERTEFCAVDAAWMIGAQVVCDVHLRALFDNEWIDGTFEDVVREAYDQYGETAVTAAMARAHQPWADRKRYPQETAAQWDEK